MLTIQLICIGKIKENFFKSAIEEYSKRLSKYCRLNILELPDEKIPDKRNNTLEMEIKNKECDNILNHIKELRDLYLLEDTPEIVRILATKPSEDLYQ